MTWIDERSLGRTIERVEERLTSGGEAFPRERIPGVVEWLLARQATSGRRRGMFQPLPDDVDGGVRVVTGERLRTRLATWNVLSHEAVRLLRRLAPNDEAVQQATARAMSTFRQHCYAQQHCAIGECAHSAISYLRLLASIEDPGNEAWIDAELATIRRHRLPTGRWKRFPFYYTLFVLLGLSSDTARDELRHAVPACQRVRSRMDPPQSVDARRSAIVGRVLALDGDKAAESVSLWDQRDGANG